MADNFLLINANDFLLINDSGDRLIISLGAATPSSITRNVDVFLPRRSGIDLFFSNKNQTISQ